MQITTISTILLIKRNFFGPKSPCYIFTEVTICPSAFFPRTCILQRKLLRQTQYQNVISFAPLKSMEFLLQLDPIAHFKEKREKKKHHRLMSSRNLPQLPSGLILKVNWSFMYRWLARAGSLSLLFQFIKPFLNLPVL